MLKKQMNGLGISLIQIQSSQDQQCHEKSQPRSNVQATNLITQQELDKKRASNNCEKQQSTSSLLIIKDNKEFLAYNTNVDLQINITKQKKSEGQHFSNINITNQKLPMFIKQKSQQIKQRINKQYSHHSQSTFCEPNESDQNQQPMMILSSQMLCLDYGKRQRFYSEDLILNHTNQHNKSSQINQQQQHQQYLFQHINNKRRYSLNTPEQDYQIIIQKVDNQIYIRVNQTSIQINQNTISHLQEYFRKAIIPIPMPSQQIFKQEHSEKFWCIYFKYLYDTNSQILQDSLLSISKNKERKLKRPQQSKGYLNLIYQYFHKSAYSKARILKSHLMLKISILQKVKLQKHFYQPYAIKALSSRNDILQQLANLQMIIAFQNSIVYFKNQKFDLQSSKSPMPENLTLSKRNAPLDEQIRHQIQYLIVLSKYLANSKEINDKKILKQLNRQPNQQQLIVHIK